MSRVKDDPLYGRWSGMRSRCLSPSNKKYHRYGGRGIKICSEWDDFHTYKQWAVDNGYEEHLTIDRIDNDGNYEPNNCRWVCQKTQQNNRGNNHLLKYNGDEYTLEQLAEKSEVTSESIKYRLSIGMSVEEAVETEANFDYVDISYKGEKKNLAQWCRELNLNYGTISSRIHHGWDPVRALKTPVRKGNYNRGVQT